MSVLAAMGPSADSLVGFAFVLIFIFLFLYTCWRGRRAERQRFAAQKAADTRLIRSYIDRLIKALGRVNPPIRTGTLEALYAQRDYPQMLGWVKNTMRLDLRVGLRIVDAVGPSPPMWIETPKPMPRFGTPEFRKTRVIVNARRDVLETKPFNWVVAGFAHELSHVVLFSIGHPLQDKEKAVDLTAMILGFQEFIVNTIIVRSHEMEWLGYLTSDERQFAYSYIENALKKRSA